MERYILSLGVDQLFFYVVDSLGAPPSRSFVADWNSVQGLDSLVGVA